MKMMKTIRDIEKMIISFQCHMKVGDIVLDCYEDDICSFCLTNTMIGLAYKECYKEYL